jgi:hypothetical protein
MWSKVLGEKLTVAQLMSKFHASVESVLTAASILSQGTRQYRATFYVTGLPRERRGRSNCTAARNKRLYSPSPSIKLDVPWVGFNRL